MDNFGNPSIRKEVEGFVPLQNFIAGARFELATFGL